MGKDQNLAVNTFKHWILVLKDPNYCKKTPVFQFHVLVFLQIDIPQSVNSTKTEKKIILFKFLHKSLLHLCGINVISCNMNR